MGVARRFLVLGRVLGSTQWGPLEDRAGGTRVGQMGQLLALSLTPRLTYGVVMSQCDGDGGLPIRWIKRKKKVLVAAKGSFLPGARLAVIFS